MIETHIILPSFIISVIADVSLIGERIFKEELAICPNQTLKSIQFGLFDIECVRFAQPRSFASRLDHWESEAPAELHSQVSILGLDTLGSAGRARLLPRPPSLLTTLINEEP